MTGGQLLAAFAGAAAAVGIVDWAHAWAAARSAADGTARGVPGGSGREWVPALLVRLGRPLARRAPATLADRLAASGVEARLEDVAAAKAGTAAVALTAAAPVAAAHGLRGALALALVAAAAGFFAPDVWLGRRARARTRAIEADLADVLDLLRVTVAAGMPPSRALAEVGRRHPGVLARELAAAARREALGVPREEALRRLRRRAPSPGVASLVAAFARATRHGAPLEETLAALAADARARRARALTERAASAAPKIQLVVALVLVPGVLALVAAALVPALTGGL